MVNPGDKREKLYYFTLSKNLACSTSKVIHTSSPLPDRAQQPLLPVLVDYHHEALPELISLSKGLQIMVTFERIRVFQV